MGIKGLNEELRDCGQTIAFSRLAINHLERTGKKLRIAIDISIWMFQLRSAQGGFSPELRTLFYRLCRLMSIAVDPIFVFDGPNKPKIKRNKQSTRSEGAKAATAQAKRIIRMFGYQFHDAPGEAEAECALIQQRGVVDAVLSEDVDTIMFGCTHTLRFSRSVKSTGQPTHVVAHHATQIREKHGLDREGMVLIALMSGGDYDPEGLPNCGVKVASEAARAGFGKTLCALKSTDKEGIRQWREKLQHELATNESKLFRQKHSAIKIPETFPNMEVLRYYTHPVVSSDEVVQRLTSRPDSEWSKPINISEMRLMTQEFFDWCYLGGALKLIRVISPSLLVQKLLTLSEHPNRAEMSLEDRLGSENMLIKRIKNRRQHESTDNLPELRVEYVPLEITGLDISNEPIEEIVTTRGGLATNSDDEFETEVLVPDKPIKVYDPSVPVLDWIPEVIVRLGAPLAAEDFDGEAGRKAKAKADAVASKRSRSARSVTQQLPSEHGFKQTDLTNYLSSSPSKARTIDITSSPVKPSRRGPIQRAKMINTVTNPSRDTGAEKPLNPWAASGARKMPVQSKSAHAVFALGKKASVTGASQCPLFQDHEGASDDNNEGSPELQPRSSRSLSPQKKTSPSPPSTHSTNPPKPGPCLKLGFLNDDFDFDDAYNVLATVAKRSGPKLPSRPRTPERASRPAPPAIELIAIDDSSPEPAPRQMSTVEISKPTKENIPLSDSQNHSSKESLLRSKRTLHRKLPSEQAVFRTTDHPSKRRTAGPPITRPASIKFLNSSPPAVAARQVSKVEQVSLKGGVVSTGSSRDNAVVLSDSEDDVVGMNATGDENEDSFIMPPIAQLAKATEPFDDW